MVSEFKNEPLLDFNKPDTRRSMEAALAGVLRETGREIPVIIGGERIKTKNKKTTTNPCNPAEFLATVYRGDKGLAEKALKTATQAFDSWRFVPAAERANVLFKAADGMRRRRYEMDATLVLEVSKSWIEADADTCEAIDFLEFYGREMLRYSGDQPLVRVPGEKNRLEYIPLGMGVVIAPWNFPNAILCGMVAAAVVSGNTVVMKPASSAPLTGYKVFEILKAAGLPDGVLNFVPAAGGEVGDYLVDSPLTRWIAFTGSRDVGVRIYERAAKVQPGQRWLKRVVAEMGGKDAIIVDDDADIEDAATGAVQAAYGFQGQKCSACSRLIATPKSYEKVLDLVVKKTKALKVGDVRNPDNTVGAVIDESAYKKILSYLEIAKREGKVMAGGTAAKEAGPGYFIKPTVVANVSEKARIAKEEIFGPVLAVIKAKDFDDALRIANNTDYGLTGAVYTNKKDRIERAEREFHAGNLYVNRKCTGAMVGVHPFGGFNMSGTDSKAGGRDYLLLFLQAKTISERVAQPAPPPPPGRPGFQRRMPMKAGRK
ncbi:MAG TPA: L-glutamate gamma-semialdehyde dehydrogenase [Planctomycetota bacterium]|nr:L-glutamate gamma-semialdehyde dehydrogenase [Planctomycetota bacterium]